MEKSTSRRSKWCDFEQALQVCWCGRWSERALVRERTDQLLKVTGQVSHGNQENQAQCVQQFSERSHQEDRAQQILDQIRGQDETVRGQKVRDRGFGERLERRLGWRKTRRWT